MQKLLAVALFLGTASLAQAGIVVEPFIGYGAGNYSLTIAGSGTTPSLDGKTTKSVSGALYGARVGYGFGPLVLGGEYQLSSYKAGALALNPSEISVFAEARSPFGLSALMGYAVSNKGDGLDGNGGFKLGLGYSLLGLIKLNADYMIRKYDDVTPHPAGVSAGSSFTSEIKTFQVSVSIPMEF